jgi:hypothetical protein
MRRRGDEVLRGTPRRRRMIERIEQGVGENPEFDEELSDDAIDRSAALICGGCCKWPHPQD